MQIYIFVTYTPFHVIMFCNPINRVTTQMSRQVRVVLSRNIWEFINVLAQSFLL